MAGIRGRGFPSGRLAVTRRPETCKRRAAVRKTSGASLDSGYSLCSTDSEDQVFAINKGLDQCAALLQDILQSEATEKSLKTRKMPVPKVSVKSSAMKGTKSTVRKTTTVPVVQKEKGILRKSVLAGGCNGGTQRPGMTVQPPVFPTLDCEHIPTQMQRLHRMTSQAAAATSSSVPPVSPQCNDAAAPYNCRLPSSTPVLSPQRSGNNCNSKGYHQALPAGGAAHNVRSPVQYQSDLLSQLHNYKNQIRDSDLLQCVAAHLAQLHRSENSGPDHAEPVSETEHPIRETDELSSEEEDAVPVSLAAMRDGSCQTSFTQYSKSPEKTEAKIKTVTILLQEIKALVADHDDGEALRLVTELERFVSLLPGVVGSNNIHAEIAIALQPLRSENTQLRRRLRILNQQLRERERCGRSDEQDHELTSLQSLNETLQQQLDESKTSLRSLQRKNEELLKVIEEQKEEKATFVQSIQEKEQEILQLQRHNDLVSATMRTEVEDTAGKMKRLQFKLEDSEKENQILQITLRQRDTEVARLRDLTRTLQASMAKLLCDLGKGNAKSKRESSLTEAALDIYEKQLQNDQCPASTSIMNYLQRLETDQVIRGTDKPLPITTRNGISKPGDSPVGKAPVSSQDYGTAHMLGPCNLHKDGVGLGSESCYLTGDEHRPDDTMYLPLASSPHTPHFTSQQQQMCTPPKAGHMETEPFSGSNTGFSSLGKFTSGPKTSANTLDPMVKVPQQLRIAEPCSGSVFPPNNSSLTHAPTLQRRNAQVIDSHPIDHSMLDFRSGKSDWTFASFSTFTSHDEQDFRSGLAALDANIAKLQRTLQISVSKK